MSPSGTIDSKDEFLKTLGGLVVEWSHLESTVKDAISLCASNHLGLNERLTAGEWFSSLLTLLNSLFRYRVFDEDALASFKKLHTELGTLSTRRNDLIHSEWRVWELEHGFLESDPPLLYVQRTQMKKRVNAGFGLQIETPNTKTLLDFIEETKQMRLRLEILVTSRAEEIKANREFEPPF